MLLANISSLIANLFNIFFKILIILFKDLNFVKQAFFFSFLFINLTIKLFVNISFLDGRFLCEYLDLCHVPLFIQFQLRLINNLVLILIKNNLKSCNSTAFINFIARETVIGQNSSKLITPKFNLFLLGILLITGRTGL